MLLSSLQHGLLLYLFIYVLFYYLFVTFLVHITYILLLHITTLFFLRRQGICYLNFIVFCANNDNRGMKEFSVCPYMGQCEFNNHTLFEVLPLPSSPFMNPIVIFSVVLEGLQASTLPRTILIQGMEEACGDTEAEACQGWIHQSRRYFPRCMATENITCDGNEVLWPDPHRRHDRLYCLLLYCILFVLTAHVFFS